MAKQMPAKLAEPIPANIAEILGPPPILTTEDSATYYAMLSCFARDVAPSDIIAWIWIKDLTDHRLEIARFRRFKAGIMQRAYEKRIATIIEKVNLDAASKTEVLGKNAVLAKQIVPHTLAQQIRLERREAGTRDKPQAELTEPERVRLKSQVEKREAEIDAKLKADLAETERRRVESVQRWKLRPATDRDLGDELDYWMHDFQKVEQLQEIAEKRFREALRALERHVAGFSRRLQENLSKIINGEVVSRESADPA